MASLAELLDYDQRKKQMLDALQTGFNKSYSVADAFTHGLADQVGGVVGLMTTDPRETISNLYQAGKSVVQNPRAAVQAAKEGLTEAVSSPQNIARFAGQNFNPLELANALNKVGTMRELTVYHGTPHTLPPTANNPLGEFDASKIGTGEGAAAYGHGIYVAENPAVAKEYSKDRSYVGRFLDNNGQNITWDAKRIAQEALDVHGKNAETHLEKVLKANSRSKNPDQLLANKEIENAIQLIKNNEITKKGNLYTVDLPDEKIDQMLDWDKPLSEQPHVIKALANTDDEFSAYRQQLSPKFQKIVDDMVSGKLPVHGDEAMKSWEALQRAYPNLDHNAIHDVRYRIFPNTSEGDWLHSVLSGSAAPGSGVKGGGGADLYNSLGGGAEASAKLRAAGIPGIKYLDEGSRATGLTPHYDLVRKKDGAVVWQVTEGGNALEQAKKLAASGDFELKGPTDKRTRNFVVFPGEEKSLKILSRE